MNAIQVSEETLEFCALTYFRALAQWVGTTQVVRETETRAWSSNAEYARYIAASCAEHAARRAMDRAAADLVVAESIAAQLR
jgi:hypothetical protein